MTLAGFTQQSKTGTSSNDQRGAFAFGSLTPQLQVPTTGSGKYTGGFLATAVLNPTHDNASRQNSYLQWIRGDSTINVDFASRTVALAVSGTVTATFQDGALIDNSQLTFGTGSSFAANGTAIIDLLRTGGFTGMFSNAAIGGKAINFQGISAGSNVAGASSIDGAFFGPNAANVGGSFRITGGVPDQRMDIQGAFTGAK